MKKEMKQVCIDELLVYQDDAVLVEKLMEHLKDLRKARPDHWDFELVLGTEFDAPVLFLMAKRLESDTEYANRKNRQEDLARRDYEKRKQQYLELREEFDGV